MRKNIERVLASDDKRALLKDVTPFEWVAVCALPPYGGYAYEYPPSQEAVDFFKALGAEALRYSNSGDGPTVYLFRTVDGEIKEFSSVFKGVRMASDREVKSPCYTVDEAVVLVEQQLGK